MSLNLFLPDAGAIAPPTLTTLASSGGLLINIDSATGDIPVTANSWIENERFGWYFNRGATNAAAEFDSAVTRTGRLTLKLSTTNATGRAKAFTYDVAGGSGYNQKFLIPCKPSTKYKLSCWVKTNNVATNSAFFLIEQLTSALGLATSGNSTALTGTNDWTRIVYEVTTGATSVYIAPAPHLNVAGNISDAWFDINSMTLEEIVEPVANSLTSSSPSLVSLTAVGSTDNIDQSFLTAPDQGRGLGNFSGLQYMNSQSFTATKSKLTGVYLYKRANVGTPTGNVKIDIRTDNAGDPSSTILATYTIPLATYNALTTNAEFLVNLPCNLTAGTKYHIVGSNTATEASGNFFNLGALAAGGYSGGDNRYSTDGGSTWSVNGTADMYFKTLYYKPTTNFKASQNNSTVSISADEDGFLDGSVINIVNGTFAWDSGVGSVSYNTTPYYSDYSRTAGSWNATTGNRIISSVNNAEWIWKLPAGLTNISLVWTSTVSGGSTAEISSSLDNSSYTVGSTGTFSGTVTLIDGARYVKIKSQGTTVKLETLTISATYSTAGLSTLRNYPTNKDIMSQYSTTLGSPTTTATYRATKWGFPAIEYSATEYQFLNVDTTATGSTVAFSETGASYTTVADGASLTITSTSTPAIWVKHNITANRLYLSSNDYNASSDKDGSMKQSVVYQVKSISTQSRNTKLSNKGASLKLTYG